MLKLKNSIIIQIFVPESITLRLNQNDLLLFFTLSPGSIRIKLCRILPET